MNTQREAIKNALLRGERLTRIEDQSKYGVGRLAARVEELKNELNIVRGWRKVETRWPGTFARIREYWV